MNVNKILIWGSVGTLAVVVTGIFININRKKKVIKDIEEEIKTGAKSELSSNDAFDINYWKTAASDKLIPVAAAQKIAMDLISKYSYWGSDDEGIITLIKQLKTKAQLSQVAFYFTQASKASTFIKSDLYSFLYDALDRSILGIGSKPHFDIVKTYILNLK